MKANIKNTKIKALMLGVACAAALFSPAMAKAQAFTEEQKKELQTLMGEYIASNPDKILDAVNDHMRKQEEESRASAEKSLGQYKDRFADKALPMAGNPDGDVTVVEFFDYNCGYCKKAYQDIRTLLGEDKNLRVVFQEMPILSASSNMMAAIALAAHKQGKYFEMHVALMDYRGSQSEEAFLELAKNTGLDVEKIKTDVSDPATRNSFQENISLANNLGIRGTPGFIIGDKIFPGYIGLEGLRDAIKEARAASAPAKK